MTARRAPASKKKSKRLCRPGRVPLAAIGTATRKTKLSRRAWYRYSCAVRVPSFWHIVP